MIVFLGLHVMGRIKRHSLYTLHINIQTPNNNYYTNTHYIMLYNYTDTNFMYYMYTHLEYK